MDTHKSIKRHLKGRNKAILDLINYIEFDKSNSKYIIWADWRKSNGKVKIPLTTRLSVGSGLSDKEVKDLIDDWFIRIINSVKFNLNNLNASSTTYTEYKNWYEDYERNNQ